MPLQQETPLSPSDVGGEFSSIQESKKGESMAKCPYCKKVTLLGEEEFEKSSFQCSHCKKIVSNKAPSTRATETQEKQKKQEKQKNQVKQENTASNTLPEEEEDEDEIYDEEEEENRDVSDQESTSPLPKVILGVGLALLVGLGLVLSLKPSEELPVVGEDPWVAPSVTPAETLFVLQPLSRILPEEAVFGGTVPEITQANPDLFAMNSQGKHWGNFEQGLTLPLDPPVSVGTIFYFFDGALTLQNLEFQLRPQDTQFSQEEIEELTSSLSLWYELVEQGEQWYLWKATDGFLALSIEHQFLYVSDEEEKVRSVLP